MNVVKPIVSVVVCTYNGAKNISNCIESLQNQDLNKTAYQIIVVDDCSTDATSQILSKFDVLKIKNASNLGLAQSRNIGVMNTSADIIAFTDDDCIADPSWLKNLLKPFENNEIVGVGGKILPNTQPDSIAVRYLSENNPLLPVNLADTINKNNIQRLINYLKRLVKPFDQETDEQELYSLIGANMAFRKDVLASVNGFDGKLRNSAEDEDVCKRIRLAFPRSKLIYTKYAVINHIFDSSLKKSLSRNKSYGKNSAKLYLKHENHGLIIFPFPMVFLLALIVGSIMGPITFGLSLLTPIVMYPSGLLKFTKKIDTFYLIDPYIHLLHDIYSNIGFFQGYLEVLKETH